jgi:hypothetical protein
MTMSTTHEHTHPHEAAMALGDVPMLDIGGDVGAIVAHLTGPTRSGELEACPVDGPERRFHTGVHHRSDIVSTAYVAVFPQVVEGRYHLLHDDGTIRATVAVTGGAVTAVDIP